VTHRLHIARRAAVAVEALVAGVACACAVRAAAVRAAWVGVALLLHAVWVVGEAGRAVVAVGACEALQAKSSRAAEQQRSGALFRDIIP
jgi:hypothetical protein